MNPHLIFACILIALMTIACHKQLAPYLNERIFGFSFEKMWWIEKFHIPLSLAILVLGIAWRVYQFPNNPQGINQDEAMASVDALALAQYGTDRFGMSYPVHFTAWGFGQMSVLLSYLMVPFIKLFGFSTFSIRLPSLLVSTLALYVLYDLSRRIWGIKLALLLLVLAVINPWHFMQSRWSIDCNLFPHFFLFSLYFLYLSTVKKIYIYVSMVLFALTMYTYGIAFYVVPLFLCIACLYMWVHKWVNLKEIVLSFIVYIGIAWPIFAMLAINYWKLPTITAGPITIPFFPGTQRLQDILLFSPDKYIQWTNNVKSMIDVIIFQLPDAPWNAMPHYGSMYVALIPAMIAGIVIVVKHYQHLAIEDKDRSSSLGLYLMISWLVVVFISGSIINDVNINRINITWYPSIIFSAVGVYQLIKKLHVSIFFVVLILLASWVGSNTTYFGTHQKDLSPNYFAGFGDAFEYVDQVDYRQVYVTSNTQYPGAWNVSEILTMYYEKLDAEYIQGKRLIVDERGVTWLPYQQRYRMTNFAENLPEYADDVVYIVNNQELSYFSLNDYEIKRFAYYSAVIPKQMKLYMLP
jgi:4-amino-4-deoxy-L-arabinose transferase-like glycosyltransferase